MIFAIVLGFTGLIWLLQREDNVLYGQKDGKILASSDGENDISEYVLGQGTYTVAENSDYIMELDGNANLIMRHRSTGSVWTAVPADNGGNSKFSSSLIIDFFTDNSTQQTLYSSENSVDLNQAKVFKTDNGAKVEYILGEMQVEYVYPQMISKQRMEKFFESMEPEDIEFLERRYSLYELEFFSEEDKKTLIYQYPKLEKEDLYILTEEPTRRNKERLTQVFADAGYTEEDLKIDNDQISLETENPQTFKIALNYTLTDTGFKVHIDSGEVGFYSQYPIKNISILPNFDAVTADNRGYFVIPSGSGALMRAETDGAKAEISVPVYGNNLASVSDYQTPSELCSLPVFGQYKNGRGYLCIISDAAVQATVNAGRDPVCSAVSANFSFIDTINTSLSSKNNVTFFADQYAAERFSVEYLLLPELAESTAYSAMANVYRNRLINDGILKDNAVNENAVLLAEITNVINYDDMALGFIPVNREYAMTTYDQTAQIAREIAEYTGSENLNVLITGWNNKGVNRQKIGSIDLSSAAGGKKAYTALLQELSEKNIRTYLDLNFSLTESFSDDGFSPSGDAVRGITNSIIKLNVRDALTNSYTETAFRLIAPVKFENIWMSYSESKYLTADGVGVSALTSLLYANYHNDSVFTREESVKEIEKVASSVKSASKLLLGDTGNLYALKYMDFINNLPASSSGNNAFERSIPFVQMVLHGSVPYTSEAVNSSADLNISLLRLIETGSGLHYSLTANTFDRLFETEYSYLYNTSYGYLKDEIAESYNTLNTALKGLGDKAITEHSYITDKVARVVYENGSKIYVNYGKSDYEAEGITVKAESYLRVDK